MSFTHISYIERNSIPRYEILQTANVIDARELVSTYEGVNETLE